MKCVDLFAGAGGLSCGLKQAGFQSILANELMPQFANTYKANHPDAEVVVGDIRNVCEMNLQKKLQVEKGEIDLVAGGPPCQGFSINAPIRSLDDDRNHLFKDFLRVVSALLPKAVLIENVPGIISLGKGTVVQQIYKELESMGYHVKHMILFAGHYGIPQMRFRTVFLAFKNFSKDIEFPEPTHNSSAVANFKGASQLCFQLDPLFANSLLPQVTVSQAFSDLPVVDFANKSGVYEYAMPCQNSFQEYLREHSANVTGHLCNKIAKINQERLSFIPQGGSWRDIPFELLPEGLKRARRSDHTKRYGRLHPNSLCSTILTKCDPHWGSFFHPYEDRVITVREAARIQSFPDDYIFTGGLTQQYEQVGNAVPPILGREIGIAIKKHLESR